MKFIRIFLLVLIILGIIALATQKLWVPKLVERILSSEKTLVVTENSIVGCYVAHLAKDVYTLKISSEQDESISGQLDINNAEKDSSTGPIKGTYKNGIIQADYTFQSEGVESVGWVAFKKIGNDFVRGYGASSDNVTYDTSVVYKKVSENECPISAPVTQPNVTLTDGRQCYIYNHDATPDAPYAVNEFLDITITGTKVTGNKTGTEKGPDMDTGYGGSITGTLEKNTITDVYSYIIEQSHNKEKEIYQINKTGLEKLRYPLVGEKGILVPDLTKPYQALPYARVECTGSN